MNISNIHNEEEPSEWVTLYAFGELPADERRLFEQHLSEGCAACSAALRQIEEVMADLAAGVSMAPPPGLRERLMKSVAEKLAAGEAARQERDGILLRTAGLLIKRSDELPWEDAPIPGISTKALYVDEKRKYYTSLVRLEAKAVYPSHRHNDTEEVFLLNGDFLIEGVRMMPGDFCRSELGSVHGQSTTESGALLLVFASQRDEILV